VKPVSFHMSGRVPIRLLIFGATGLAAFAYGFLLNSPAGAGLLVQKYGYYVVLAAFVWWLWAVGRSVGREARALPAKAGGILCRHRWAAVMIAGLTLVAVFSVPYNYKVLYDELVLQSTASSMHLFRETASVQRGYEVAGEFRTLEVYLDKRPLFYPFVVSLAHDLTGFRVLNAYLINTLLMPVALTLLYGVAGRMGGRAAGLAAVACFGASPLLIQNANGTGMELLNVVMILASLWLAIRYLEKPGEDRLSALVLACVLLVQTRYESAIYAAPTALVVFEGWRRAGRVVMSWAAIAAPLLLLPYALQNTYVSGTPVLWELSGDATKRFGLGFLGKNLTAAVQYFFEVTPMYLNTPLLSVLGMGALAWMVWRFVRGGWREWRNAPAAWVVAALFGAGALANLSLLMLYYWGQFTDPLVFRLALPVDLALVLAITWRLGILPMERRAQIAGWVMSAALLAYLAFGARASARFETLNQIGTEIAWGQEWMARQPPKSRLIITHASSLNWLLEKTPALGIKYASGRGVQIARCLEDGTLGEVLVFQYYRPTGPGGGFVLDPDDVLPAAFKLEPVTERLFGAKQIRISRVVGIDVKEAARHERTLLVGGLWVGQVPPAESSAPLAEAKAVVAPTTGQPSVAPTTEAVGRSAPAMVP